MSDQVTPDKAGWPPAPQQPAASHRHPSWWWGAAGGISLLAGLLAILVLAQPAAAVAAHRVLAAGTPAAPTLDSVINGLRNWLVGLLAAVATLFLTIGGIRYITAGGDPMHVERAKTALKSAAIGYALAALSPLLIGVLRSIVG
jgi:Type IV secretion system pilin